MGQRWPSNARAGLLAFAMGILGLSPQLAISQTSCGGDLELVGSWDGYSGGAGYADVWGDGDIAYVGTYFDSVVHFFDISDPANPDRFLEWQVGSPNEFASAQDIKTADGLLFIALDSNGNDGVEIVDIRDPFNPQHLTWIDVPGYSDVHNVFYDNGYLYLADSRTPRVGIVDLTEFDPDDPPSRITDALWILQNIGSVFVHDITVKDGRMYACAWNSGLYIFDVTNVANEPPVLLGQGPPQPATHAVWPTDDGRWAVVGEERNNGPLKLYEITESESSLTVEVRDEMLIPGVFSIHNPIVVGLRVYASWYGAGTLLLEINEDTKSFDVVSQYDTTLGGSQGGFGTWGVFPLLGDDRILASDNGAGLFILSAGGNCDDGAFCNGQETCNEGICQPGFSPCDGQLCREEDDQCVDCLVNGDCDNFVFCDGAELCDVVGTCQSGGDPCPDQLCDEAGQRCVDCFNDADCDSDDFCTVGTCVDNVCVAEPLRFGDVNDDEIVDIGDIFCVLDGFRSVFKHCTFVEIDIADCSPDGLIDISDIFAVLDAFSGEPSCCDAP